MRPVAWTFNRGLIASALLAQLLAIFVYGRFRPQVFLSVEMLAIAPALVLLALLLVWRPHAWEYLAAAAGALVLPVILLVVVSHGHLVLDPLLTHDFAAKTLLLLAAALAVPAGISGWLRARRGTPTLSFRDRLRTPTGLAAMTTVGIAVGAIAAGILAGAHAPESASIAFDVAPEARIESASRYFEFVPKDLSLHVGVPTEVRAINEDVAIHTFTYALGDRTFDHELPAGATTTFVVLFDEAGTVPYWCKLHATPDHARGMVGTIRVEE